MSTCQLGHGPRAATRVLGSPGVVGSLLPPPPIGADTSRRGPSLSCSLKRQGGPRSLWRGEALRVPPGAPEGSAGTLHAPATPRTASSQASDIMSCSPQHLRASDSARRAADIHKYWMNEWMSPPMTDSVVNGSGSVHRPQSQAVQVLPFESVRYWLCDL